MTNRGLAPKLLFCWHLRHFENKLSGVKRICARTVCIVLLLIKYKSVAKGRARASPIQLRSACDASDSVHDHRHPIVALRLALALQNELGIIEDFLS